MKEIIEYIKIAVIVFLITKYICALYYIDFSNIKEYSNGEIVLISKIKNYSVDDVVIIKKDNEVALKKIINNNDQLSVKYNDELKTISDDEIYGKVVFRIWPLF